jgi:hypothetical protein
VSLSSQLQVQPSWAEIRAQAACPPSGPAGTGTGVPNWSRYLPQNELNVGHRFAWCPASMLTASVSWALMYTTDEERALQVPCPYDGVSQALSGPWLYCQPSMDCGNVSVCTGPATGVRGQLTGAAFGPVGTAAGEAGVAVTEGAGAGLLARPTGAGDLAASCPRVLAAALHPAAAASSAHPISAKRSALRSGNRNGAAAPGRARLASRAACRARRTCRARRCVITLTILHAAVHAACPGRDGESASALRTAAPRGYGVTGMTSAETSTPASMPSTPTVPCGWPRRSVGEPGLKIWKPPPPSASGICE